MTDVVNNILGKKSVSKDPYEEQWGKPDRSKRMFLASVVERGFGQPQWGEAIIFASNRDEAKKKIKLHNKKFPNEKAYYQKEVKDY